MNRFPTVDAPIRELDDSREILWSGFIEPADDRMDGDWCTLPLRSVVTDDGPSFEIGPYSLTESDLTALHLALGQHFLRFPDRFRLVQGQAS